MAKKTARRLVLSAAVFLLLIFSVTPIITAFAGETAKPPVQISMWLYPVGDFGNPETVDRFVAAFQQKHPEISVSVEYLDYSSGDDRIEDALSAGTAPDLVMEGPERLVADWGAKGVMADLSDLWMEDTVRDISADGDFVVRACKNADGRYFEYPLCKTVHCMAINYEVFEKVGALQYLDPEKRTWTTENFKKACKAVADSGLVETPGLIYCGGQGGDQGTRALVTNLYGAAFTNADHTQYTVNGSRGVQALAVLASMTEEGLLSRDTDIQAAEELKRFAAGKTAMTFAWNSANEKSYAQKVGFTPFAMTFPTDQKAPELCSGIWGFGIFDSGDDARTAAAKELIHFLCDDAEQGRQSVLASHVFPVRASFGDVYNGTPDEERMNDYRKMLPYAGDYYNVTPGWTAQRTVWWNMLQQLFSGTDPQEAADWYARIANRAIDGTGQSPVPGIARNLTKRALFISSDSLNDPTVKEQIRGIQNELGENVYLHFEFMDSSAISDEDYVASFYRYISYKYSHLGGLGAIIVGDDNALQMVIRYQNGFFRDIPVVYESVNSRTLTELADSLGMTGVLAENTTDATLDIARRIYPNAAGILAVSDQSAVGSALTAHLQAVKSKYGPLKVDILDTSKLGAQQIADRVGGCGTETILLFMRFTTDAAGKAYTAPEALRLITGHAKTPVFTLEWLGEGSLGGVEADSGEIGRQAGRIARKYLDGVAPDGAETAAGRTPTSSAFDASVLEQFGIPKKKLPADAVFYNEADSSGRLTAIIAALAAAIILLTFFLIQFGKENRKRRKNESQLKETSEMLRTEAEMDGLTGLGNRRMFDRELDRSIRSGRHFILYMLDLDNFKRVNDRYGHPGGDRVLRETGRRLNTLKSRTFVPYRIGGDEFSVMAFSSDGDYFKRTEEKLLELFREKLKMEADEMEIRVSIGSAVFPEDAAAPDELIRCADKALYAVKAGGKNGAQRFHRT